MAGAAGFWALTGIAFTIFTAPAETVLKLTGWTMAGTRLLLTVLATPFTNFLWLSADFTTCAKSLDSLTDNTALTVTGGLFAVWAASAGFSLSESSSLSAGRADVIGSWTLAIFHQTMADWALSVHHITRTLLSLARRALRRSSHLLWVTIS